MMCVLISIVFFTPCLGKPQPRALAVALFDRDEFRADLDDTIFTETPITTLRRQLPYSPQERGRRSTRGSPLGRELLPILES
jgi:hypothetical protein